VKTDRCCCFNPLILTSPFVSLSFHRRRALVDFSPFVSVGGPAKSEGDVVEDIDRSLDPLLYARRLMRSLGARRNSLPQHIDLPSPRRRDSDAPAPVQRSAAAPESDAGEAEHSASATSATNGDETSAPAAGETASSEDSGNEKDDNELYQDNKVSSSSHRLLGCVAHFLFPPKLRH
jgi:hypothetical protein